jgi:hypothetical protein
MIGSIGINNVLNNIGFKTFENYMLHKDYNSHDIIDNFNYLPENFNYFLNNFVNSKIEINSDIEHNFSTYMKYCRNNLDQIFNFINVEKTEDNIFLLLHDLEIKYSGEILVFKTNE